jgi:hypothetical protein
LRTIGVGTPIEQAVEGNDTDTYADDLPALAAMLDLHGDPLDDRDRMRLG